VVVAFQMLCPLKIARYCIGFTIEKCKHNRISQSTWIVTHIILGKWLQVGLVLVSKHQYESKQSTVDAMAWHGASTFIGCKEQVLYWKEACDQLPKTEMGRDKILKKIKIK
jgi:hypothetical protein